MRKIYLTLLLTLTCLATYAQQTIPVDVTANWLTYMTVFDSADNGGGYMFENGGWGIPDLVALVDGTAQTIEFKPNRIADTNPYWQTGNLQGNKVMEATFYVEDDALLGKDLVFKGTVLSHTLNNTGMTDDFTHFAFIKVFAADYSAVLAEVRDEELAVGDFSVALDASGFSGGEHLQYGFQIKGPNINPDAAFDSDYDALGSIIIGNLSLLPIKFLDFTGDATTRGNKLVWKTSSEYNNAGFKIERSVDGINFQTIGYIDGAGNRSSRSTYEFVDRSVTPGTYFYRIVQEDFSGSTQFSTVIKLEVENSGKLIMAPNPVENDLYISADKAISSLTIFDANGRALSTVEGPQSIVSVSELETGNYFIEVNYEDGTRTTKQIIKK